jgi:hypothetical protein
MAARRPFIPVRFNIKTWWAVIAILWIVVLGVMLGFISLVLQVPQVVPQALWELARGSFQMLGNGPSGIIGFLLLWLPFLTAPFGLFERIPTE